MVAATEVLVPIQCEYYALEGVGQLVRNVELVRKSLNQSLEISTIVLVMYDARTKLAGQVVDEVRAHFGEIVCKIVIPRVVRLSEAPSYGQPITVFDPTNRGAQAYRDLANEVLGNELDLEAPPVTSPIQPGKGLADSPLLDDDMSLVEDVFEDDAPSAAADEESPAKEAAEDTPKDGEPPDPQVAESDKADTPKANTSDADGAVESTKNETTTTNEVMDLVQPEDSQGDRS